MKALVFASALVMVAFGAPARAQQAHQDFTLVNATGYDIKEVYVSTAKTNSWEEDVLGDDELVDGHETHIKFSNSSKACKWDLKVVYSVDDSSAVWSGIDLCKISTITIKWNKKTQETTAVFD